MFVFLKWQRILSQKWATMTFFYLECCILLKLLFTFLVNNWQNRQYLAYFWLEKQTTAISEEHNTFIWLMLFPEALLKVNIVNHPLKLLMLMYSLLSMKNVLFISNLYSSWTNSFIKVYIPYARLYKALSNTRRSQIQASPTKNILEIQV